MKKNARKGIKLPESKRNHLRKAYFELVKRLKRAQQMQDLKEAEKIKKQMKWLAVKLGIEKKQPIALLEFKAKK